MTLDMTIVKRFNNSHDCRERRNPSHFYLKESVGQEIAKVKLSLGLIIIQHHGQQKRGCKTEIWDRQEIKRKERKCLTPRFLHRNLKLSSILFTLSFMDIYLPPAIWTPPAEKPFSLILGSASLFLQGIQTCLFSFYCSVYMSHHFSEKHLTGMTTLFWQRKPYLGPREDRARLNCIRIM